MAQIRLGMNVNLINTVALARWLALPFGNNRFNGLREKPLKRLKSPVSLLHRANATVLTERQKQICAQKGRFPHYFLKLPAIFADY